MAGDTTMTIVGNLVNDPLLSYTPAGVAMLKFTIASTPRTLDKRSGEWVDGETLFLLCTAWRELAENAAESLSKGNRVVATGRLRQSHWQTEDGQNRSALGLDVDDIGPSLRFAAATVRKLARTRSDKS